MHYLFCVIFIFPLIIASNFKYRFISCACFSFHIPVQTSILWISVLIL